MAEKYFPNPGPNNKRIPYPGLAKELFADCETQRVVPFLGAGASISEADREETPLLSEPEQDKIDGISEKLGLRGLAKDFMGAAIRVAWQIQQAESSTSSENPFERVRKSRWPPSATELAAALAYDGCYDRFTRVAERLGSRLPDNGRPARLADILSRAASITGLCSCAPPLMSVASYLSHTLGETVMCEHLKMLFDKKTELTTVHKMVASIAHYHLSQVPNAKDYLIITSNYDCLVEGALEKAAVAYCTLTVDKDQDKVVASFSKNLREYLCRKQDFDFDRDFKNMIDSTPVNCHLGEHRPIVIVYKIHGCLKLPEDGTSLILTDEDYVDYMRKNGPANSRIPSLVKDLIFRRAFLFMGYSFTDWNVRGWYKSIVEDRSMRNKHSHDWAVMNDVDPYEDGFFQGSDISLLMQDLTGFAQTIMSEAPRAVLNCGAWT